MYFIGIAIFLLGVLLTMYFKHVPFDVLVNPAAIAMHLFAIISVLTATKGFSVFRNGLKAAASPNATISEELRGRAASLFRLLSKTAALSALVVLIISVMASMYWVSEEDPVAVGQSLAAALVAPLWGAIFVAIFEPVVVIMKKRNGSK